jgi:hypothetical protein
VSASCSHFLSRLGWKGCGLSPHDSGTILLQSPIHCYDEPLAGGLALQTLHVLDEHASGPHGSAISQRTIMNHAG